ncbi:MAG: glycoside hydrolase family 3 N-terminal domain-containing protein [Planctomycetota bacterium]
MSAPSARLVLPLLRFQDAVRDPDPFLRLAERGVGGFCVFGGDHRLPGLLGRLQEAAPHPLLICADLEDGAGQQVGGCTRHPPAAALDAEAAEAAGALTAVEARRHGITMALAPCCDVLSEPENPILNVRCFRDPALGAPAFVRGARRAGLRTCAKHFPGHGGSRADSHDALPVVPAGAATWRRRDLPPFAACFEAGVDAVMSAHLDCPALTGEPALPATLSRRVMTGLLRDELGFSGVVLTDALLMKGVGADEAEAARAAFEAGCDLLLGPRDPERVLRAVRRLDAERSLWRIDAAAGAPTAGAEPDPAALRERLRDAAARSVTGKAAPVGPGPHPLRIFDLHGEGHDVAAACGLGWERRGLSGEVLDSADGPGLQAPVVAVLRRDKAWGGPVSPPPAVAEAMRAAALVVVLGPDSLRRAAPGPHLHAPGQDPFTLREVLRRVRAP